MRNVCAISLPRDGIFYFCKILRIFSFTVLGVDFLEEHYEQERDAAKTCAQISELVRRVALVYYPRVRVASLHGEAWLQFLNTTSKGLEFDSVRSLLLDAPFKTKETMDLLPLFEKVQSWIKQRGAPCSN